MTDPCLPPSLAAVFGDINRRLDTLERAQQKPALLLGSSTVATSAAPPATNLGTISGGPTVTISVPPSGCVLVLAFVVARIYLVGGLGVNGATCFMTVARSGVNTFNPAAPASITNGESVFMKLERDNTTPEAELQQPLIYARPVTGLTPGETTFTMQVAFTSDELLSAPVTVRDRSLVVIPQ